MIRTPRCDKTGLRKGKWTPEEDKKLIAHVTKYGHWNWRQLPKFAGLDRCGRSCRLRWLNYLRPGIIRGNYTQDEEEVIVKLHAMLGNRWSMIASHLPGRSDNEIKNHWHGHLKKRFQHSSVTNEKAEAFNSNHHSPVESKPEENLVEIGGLFQNNISPATCQTPDTSPSSSHRTSLSDIFCSTAPASSDGNLVLDDFANFVDTNTDPVFAYPWTEFNVADISYFTNDLLAPFMSEPESFYPDDDADIWGLFE